MTPAERLPLTLAALDASLIDIRQSLKELTMPTITLPPTDWINATLANLATADSAHRLHLVHHAETASLLSVQLEAGRVLAWSLESCRAEDYDRRAAQVADLVAAAWEGAETAVEHLAAAAETVEAIQRAKH